MSCQVALSTRSNTLDLPPNGGEPGVFNALLQGESSVAHWRLLELFSVSGQPFDVRARWSAGAGAGPGAHLTVSRATRLGVFARSLSVHAANHADQTNRVSVNVVDGFLQTENVWEVRGLLTPGKRHTVDVPPFAKRVSVGVADLSASGGTTLALVDALGRTTQTALLALTPPRGLPVGGAHHLELVSASTTGFRAVFTLSL